MKDKIRKLLALAADPHAASGEVENASRMAAKLMAKHDIELANLEGYNAGKEVHLPTNRPMTSQRHPLLK